MESFKAKYERRVKVVGRREFYRFDADGFRVPDNIKDKFKTSGAALFAYLRPRLDSVARMYPGVVFDSVRFGQYGVNGYVTLSATINYARGLGLLVLCDDRVFVSGDNADSVMLAYLALPDGVDRSETGRMALTEHGFNVDALSVAPDSEAAGLERLKAAAEALGKELVRHGAEGGFEGLLSGLTL